VILSFLRNNLSLLVIAEVGSPNGEIILNEDEAFCIGLGRSIFVCKISWFNMFHNFLIDETKSSLANKLHSENRNSFWFSITFLLSQNLLMQLNFNCLNRFGFLKKKIMMKDKFNC